MKKILFLIIFLVVSFSFGQVKKAKKKKVDLATKITTATVRRENYDDDISIGQPNEVIPVKEADKNVIYNSAGIEQKAEFAGGYDKFLAFIASNYKTPTDPDFVNGKVIVSFVVEKDGSLTDIKVLRDIGFGTGKEAIRVLKLSPKWIPGQQNGHAVRSNNQLPISVVANSGK